MHDITEAQLERFLQELMDIQRRYSTEEKNKKSNRQAEVRDMMEKFVAREIKDDN